jgi:F-type H+-transporting ATPase subunit gamma
MAKARAIVKRRKSIQNIRKITRTMELIATAQFRKALQRATEAEAYTSKIAELVADLGKNAGSVRHPLLEEHKPATRSILLVLTSNRGLAGSFNGNVIRVAVQGYHQRVADGYTVSPEVSGKRGITYLKFRGIKLDKTYTRFNDKPSFAEVEVLADRYIDLYTTGKIDRLDIAYTRFISAARQVAEVETLLPMTAERPADPDAPVSRGARAARDEPAPRKQRGVQAPYEFRPEPASILAEIVPISFKVRLFKCFLDAAVSEQIARMVAMKGATENADEMIRDLTRLYNRARQSQITRELAEVIGGAAAQD